MIEMNPLVFLDKKPVEEGVDYTFRKYSDKSIEFCFDSRGIRIKFEISPLIGAQPKLYFNGTPIERKDYAIKNLTNEGKPGVEIYMNQLPVKVLGIVPVVLTGIEERMYKAQQTKEKKLEYEKQHGDLFRG